MDAVCVSPGQPRALSVPRLERPSQGPLHGVVRTQTTRVHRTPAPRVMKPMLPAPLPCTPVPTGPPLSLLTSFPSDFV